MKKFFVVLAVAFSIAIAGSLEAAAAPRLSVSVDLSSQTMTVSRNGRVIERWPVSTGRKGFTTPTGSYKPTRMHRIWHSRKYDMTPMPFSIFYHRGYAIHGTSAVKRLGSRASHGCVRLHTANAERLYALVKDVGARNTNIVIKR